MNLFTGGSEEFPLRQGDVIEIDYHNPDGPQRGLSSRISLANAPEGAQGTLGNRNTLFWLNPPCGPELTRLPLRIRRDFDKALVGELEAIIAPVGWKRTIFQTKVRANVPVKWSDELQAYFVYAPVGTAVDLTVESPDTFDEMEVQFNDKCEGKTGNLSFTVPSTLYPTANVKLVMLHQLGDWADRYMFFCYVVPQEAPAAAPDAGKLEAIRAKAEELVALVKG